MITEGTTALRASSRSKSRAGEDAPARKTKAAEAAEARDGAGEPLSHKELLWIRVAWLVAFVLWVFIVLSLASFSPADPPTTHAAPPNSPVLNLCGFIGAWLSFGLYKMFGYGMWVLVALAGTGLLLVAMGRALTDLAIRAVGGLMLAAVVACVQALAFPASGPVPSIPGGLVGTFATHALVGKLNVPGTALVLLVAFAVAAVVTFDVWALIVASWTGRLAYSGARHAGRVALTTAQGIAERRAALKALRDEEAAAARVRETDVDDDEELKSLRPGDLGRAPAPKRKKKEDKAAPIDPTAGGLGATDSFDIAEGGLPAANPVGVEDDDEEDAVPVARAAKAAPIPADEDDEVEADAPAPAPAAAPEKARTYSPEELRAKMAKLPVRFAADSKRSATEEDLRDIQNQQNLEGYRFPGLDLLEEPEVHFSQTLEAHVREQAESLEKALREYRIEGEVVGVESGPVITMYELRLAPGTKVAALSAVSSDLARALRAINIRIVSNIAGRDTVGVEVPNAQKEKVRLKELMGKTEKYQGMKLPMFLGKDASGEPLIEDLAKMPHMLIAGTTGSGKSVCMNTIIMSFLYTKKPNELKLVLVDPKMVEMSQFKDIPHLMCPVVTEMSKAAAILEWAVNKMDERYELLAEAGCRDIAGYNELEWEDLKERLCVTTPEEEAKIPRKLPYMVFVIDELADLMMTNKEVEHSIVRIAQKARAVGMHLILATQRPQANVVTGLIKSNMPARIAFKVASGMDSRIVLDQKGGELLLGQGDMLFLSPKSSKLTRSQGTLVDDKEIRKVVKFMRDVASPTFERSLMQIRGKSAEGDEEGGEGGFEGDRNGLLNAQEDPLFDQAVEVVLETKRGSVSMLQRRLAIGYTRAARLIELMGHAGILGEHKGTVAREVAMTIEEWQAIKAQAKADAEAAEAEAKKDGVPSRPVAATLEQAQSIVNDGNLREQLEASDPKATDDLDDDEEYGDDDADGSEDDDADDEPPFEVQTRVGKGSPSRT